MKNQYYKLIISKFNPTEILSVGSGLGYIESKINKIKNNEIYINDFSGTSLKWVDKEFSKNHILIGEIPAYP